jgi:hypothetical protein
MNQQQYHSTLVIGAAGQLKAKLPPCLTPEARRHLLALAWQTPVTIEWRTR